ncbi:hypothetical protein ES703_82127 [subsurface metagenome]
MKRFFGLIKMLDKRLNPILKFEYLFFLAPVIPKGEPQPGIQISQLSYSFQQRIVCEFGIAEYLFVGLESYFCAAFVCRTDFLYRPFSDPPDTFEMIVFSITIYVCFEPFTQGIDNADADAVQPAGHFVAVTVKFAAGVQLCEHDLQGADFGLLMRRDRYASAVIFDRATAVRVDAHAYVVTESGQCFVDGVIQHLIDQMVQASADAVADIHVRPLANRFHAPQYLYLACIVFVVLHISFPPLSCISSLLADKLLNFFGGPQYRNHGSRVRR